MENKNTLPLISKKEEILKNVMTLGIYLKKLNSKECEYAKNLIKRGKCFVTVSSLEGFKFYPSRFVGYVNNTMEKHIKMGELKKTTGNITRDGRKTNPAITKVLGNLIEKNDKQWNGLENKFNKFCTEELNIKPDNKERKYWQIINL